MSFSLSVFAPEKNLVSRDGVGSPVPRQAANHIILQMLRRSRCNHNNSGCGEKWAHKSWSHGETFKRQHPPLSLVIMAAAVGAIGTQARDLMNYDIDIDRDWLTD